MVEMEHEECGQGAVELPSEDEPTCNLGSVQSATLADSENKNTESAPEADACQQDASSEHNGATKEEVEDAAIQADRTKKSDALKTDSSGNRLEIGPQPMMNDFSESPIKSGEKELAIQDPLIEVNLGSEEVKCPTYISANLSAQRQEELIKILIEYKDCFAWSYEEMPGLSREIVEHKLPIKKGFKSFKQPARRFEPSIVLKVKDAVIQADQTIEGKSVEKPINGKYLKRYYPSMWENME